MPEKQTQKSRYPSKYSQGVFVTAAQYISELVCEAKARSKKTVLTERFWSEPSWEKFYKQQIIAANGLLRTYRVEAIISALKTRQGSKIFSLHAPWLDDIIKEEQSKLELSEKIAADKAQNEKKTVLVQPKPPIVEAAPPTHRKTHGTKSLFSKLREDNGEKQREDRS